MARIKAYRQTHYQVYCFQCLRVIFDSDTKFLAEKEKKNHAFHICQIRRKFISGKAKG